MPTRARVEMLARRCAASTDSLAPENAVVVVPAVTETLSAPVSGVTVATMDWRAVERVTRLLLSTVPWPPSDVAEVWTSTKAWPAALTIARAVEDVLAAPAW